MPQSLHKQQRGPTAGRGLRREPTARRDVPSSAASMRRAARREPLHARVVLDDATRALGGGRAMPDPNGRVGRRRADNDAGRLRPCRRRSRQRLRRRLRHRRSRRRAARRTRRRTRRRIRCRDSLPYSPPSAASPPPHRRRRRGERVPAALASKARRSSRRARRRRSRRSRAGRSCRRRARARGERARCGRRRAGRGAEADRLSSASRDRAVRRAASAGTGGAAASRAACEKAMMTLLGRTCRNASSCVFRTIRPIRNWRDRLARSNQMETTSRSTPAGAGRPAAAGRASAIETSGSAATRLRVDGANGRWFLRRARSRARDDADVARGGAAHATSRAASRGNATISRQRDPAGCTRWAWTAAAATASPRRVRRCRRAPLPGRRLLGARLFSRCTATSCATCSRRTTRWRCRRRSTSPRSCPRGRASSSARARAGAHARRGGPRVAGAADAEAGARAVLALPARARAPTGATTPSRRRARTRVHAHVKVDAAAPRRRRRRRRGRRRRGRRRGARAAPKCSLVDPREREVEVEEKQPPRVRRSTRA